jgi:hypothetical protein
LTPGQRGGPADLRFYSFGQKVAYFFDIGRGGLTEGLHRNRHIMRERHEDSHRPVRGLFEIGSPKRPLFDETEHVCLNSRPSHFQDVKDHAVTTGSV